MSELINANVYRKQGGKQYVIADGGDLLIESGGTITIGDANFISTGGRTIAKQTVVAGSTAANFPNNGLVTFGSTAAKTYTLTTPVSGRTLKLVCTAADSTKVQYVQASTGTGVKTWIDGSISSGHGIKFAGKGYAVLDAYSSALWYVTSKSTTVAISTGTT